MGKKKESKTKYAVVSVFLMYKYDVLHVQFINSI